MNIKCPHCGTKYEVEQSGIGLQVKCQVCGKKFVVKSGNKEPAKEKVVLSVKPSMAPVVPIVLLIGVPFLLLLGAICGAMMMPNNIGCAIVMCEIIGLVLLFMLFRLSYSHMECTITNLRVVVRSGVITKCARQVHVQDMRDIFLRRGLFQRMTGTGSISIGSQTTGMLGRIIIEDIKEYQWVIETLEKLKARGGNQP